MDAYWDTSALLALIYIEPHSGSAQRAATKTTRAFAWWWLQVEAEAAMARRGATPAQRQN